MARPKSEDKYQALLAAAVAVCSVLGLEAPTSKIACTAGVAEGTLVIPLGFPEIPAHNLASDRWNGLQVEITLRNEQ